MRLNYIWLALEPYASNVGAFRVILSIATHNHHYFTLNPRSNFFQTCALKLSTDYLAFSLIWNDERNAIGCYGNPYFCPR